jgi:hypothetical protein
MTRARIFVAAGAVALVVLAVLALVVGRRLLELTLPPAEASPLVIDTSSGSSPSTSAPGAEGSEGFLYGRVTTTDGATYEGRLRLGGGQEAFWGDFFNAYKDENPWAVHAPPATLVESRPLEVFGFEIAKREREIDVTRPFMVRFGDIARVEAQGRDLRVTLKSGTVVELDRYGADDFADGVRVWVDGRGIMDFPERRMRSIELLPAAEIDGLPGRLHGTVRTPRGEFTGFVQWNRRGCVGTDELVGDTADGRLRLRFDLIRSIARRTSFSSSVTLIDGREIVLSGTSDVGEGSRGIFVDDRRYGRVLIAWDAFERADFSPGGSAPGYGDFPPGRPLTGSVTTRAGGRLAGRLVFDLDESETIETLDAPSEGVNYILPFGLVSSIVLDAGDPRGARRARVTLHSGEELLLERSGDLGEGNAGMLVFAEGDERPVYAAWADVERIDLDRPPAMYPPLGGR